MNWGFREYFSGLMAIGLILCLLYLVSLVFGEDHDE